MENCSKIQGMFLRFTDLSQIPRVNTVGNKFTIKSLNVLFVLFFCSNESKSVCNILPNSLN